MKDTLLDLYNMDNPEAIYNELLDIATNKKPLPLDELFDFMEYTLDPPLLGLSIEILFANRSRIFDRLIDKFHQTDSEDLKIWILTTMGVDPSFSSMGFLMDVYMQNDTHRAYIRKNAFSDKSKVLFALARFVEENQLTDAQEKVVTDILKTIPRKVYVPVSSDMSKLKISDYYYLIDPSERHPEEKTSEKS